MIFKNSLSCELSCKLNKQWLLAAGEHLICLATAHLAIVAVCLRPEPGSASHRPPPKKV